MLCKLSCASSYAVVTIVSTGLFQVAQQAFILNHIETFTERPIYRDASAGHRGTATFNDTGKGHRGTATFNATFKAKVTCVIEREKANRAEGHCCLKLILGSLPNVHEGILKKKTQRVAEKFSSNVPSPVVLQHSVIHVSL